MYKRFSCILEFKSFIMEKRLINKKQVCISSTAEEESIEEIP